MLLSSRVRQSFFMDCLILEHETRYVVPKRRFINTLLCVKTKKIKDCIQTVTETLDHATVHFLALYLAFSQSLPEVRRGNSWESSGPSTVMSPCLVGNRYSDLHCSPSTVFFSHSLSLSPSVSVGTGK